LAVLTHIDLLSPAMEWSPPYDWQSPKRPKEVQMREAVAAAREQLGDLVAGGVPPCGAPGEGGGGEGGGGAGRPAGGGEGRGGGGCARRRTRARCRGSSTSSWPWGSSCCRWRWNRRGGEPARQVACWDRGGCVARAELFSPGHTTWHTRQPSPCRGT